jgi:thiamine pyrophosphate-dependent acetolactate synthase large subunit-like protein
MLMGLGALPTIAAQKPENLAIAVLDNEIYGETGGQPTHTSFGVSLSGMARGAGFSDTLTATDDEGLSRAVQMVLFGRGPVLCDIKVTRNASPLVMPPREGVALKNRFREALLGPDALKE